MNQTRFDITDTIFERCVLKFPAKYRIESGQEFDFQGMSQRMYLGFIAEEDAVLSTARISARVEQGKKPQL
jgi:hypothetical protein